MLVAQDHEFHLRMRPDDTRKGFHRKIPYPIELFVPENPAVDSYFHVPDMPHMYFLKPASTVTFPVTDHRTMVI
jgi:hypothetical protein